MDEPMTLFGYPIVFVEDMETPGEIVLGSFDDYLPAGVIKCGDVIYVTNPVPFAPVVVEK